VIFLSLSQACPSLLSNANRAWKSPSRLDSARCTLVKTTCASTEPSLGKMREIAKGRVHARTFWVALPVDLPWKDQDPVGWRLQQPSETGAERRGRPPSRRERAAGGGSHRLCAVSCRLLMKRPRLFLRSPLNSLATRSLRLFFSSPFVAVFG